MKFLTFSKNFRIGYGVISGVLMAILLSKGAGSRAEDEKEGEGASVGSKVLQGASVIASDLGSLTVTIGTSNTINFSWRGDSEIRLQRATRLSPPNWSDEADSAGQSEATKAMILGQAYYRLFKRLDVVGFSANYTNLQVLRTVVRAMEPRILTIFGNEEAASVTNLSQLPYPNGSLIVVEYANVLKDSSGSPILDSQGGVQKGSLHHLDVMKRGAGFGQFYGANRAGEWEFVGYRMDGSFNTSPANSQNCAACHRGAGANRDYVFRGRF